MNDKVNKRIWLLAALLLLSVYCSLRFGSSHMDEAAFWQGLLRRPGQETYSLILYTIRMPRVLAALLAGAGLSISGVLLQTVTGNDLASPNIIGVNSGAGFCVILFLCFFPTAVYALPFAAFFGAFMTTLLIVSVANRIGSGKSTIILAGIAFTAVLNAGISFLSLLDSDVLTAYNYFSIGGVAGVRLESLLIPGIVIAATFAVSLSISRKINLLCLGDSMAMSLGVPVKAVRMGCLVLASASAAAAVSFAGLLGFVGLVVPHICRKLVGVESKNLLTASVFTGGIVVVLADLAGRVLFAPSELPVGIMMSVVGAPFFFGLLLQKKGGNRC